MDLCVRCVTPTNQKTVSVRGQTDEKGKEKPEAL